MEMLKSIESSLSNLNLDFNSLQTSISKPTLDTDFTKLVCQLSQEIKLLRCLDECVNESTSDDDLISFHLEVGSFIKELNCPYDSLTQCPISSRLSSESQKLLLIDFLVTELMIARVLEKNQKSKSSDMNVTIYETPTAAELSNILKNLSILDQKHQKNITAKILFGVIQSVISKLPNVQNAIDESIFTQFGQIFISNEDWNKLEEFRTKFHKDFRNRRQLLIKRLEVTVQSFLWSDRLKCQVSSILDLFEKRKNRLECEPNVSILDLLMARCDLLVVEKTSSAVVRLNTKSFIQKHIIGPVPDRGGRPSEQAPPEPEMPSWQKQRASGPGQNQQRTQQWQPNIQKRPQCPQRDYQPEEQSQQQSQLPFFQTPHRIDYANQFAQDSMVNRQQMAFDRRNGHFRGRERNYGGSGGASNPKRFRGVISEVIFTPHKQIRNPDPGTIRCNSTRRRRKLVFCL